MYGDSAPCKAAVYDWIKCFKEGRKELEAKKRQGKLHSQILLYHNNAPNILHKLSEPFYANFDRKNFNTSLTALI